MIAFQSSDYLSSEYLTVFILQFSAVITLFAAPEDTTTQSQHS